MRGLALLAAAAAVEWPACVDQGVVLRHNEEHGVFVDLRPFGVANARNSGCWQESCGNTDKFATDSAESCAAMCARLTVCSWWSFGEDNNQTVCFFRKSDAGREELAGFLSAPRGCVPPGVRLAMPVSHAQAAYVAFTSRQLRACTEGGCDVHSALATYGYAIGQLKQAMLQAPEHQQAALKEASDYADQTLYDLNFAKARQATDEALRIVAANAEQLFEGVRPWLEGMERADLDATDSALPLPLRGQLCRRDRCHEDL